MNTIPLRTLIQALEALKRAEAYVDEQPLQGDLWCALMKARVSLDLYVNRALEGQSVTIEQDIEGTPV
jgi:hypothetical protein